MYYSNNLETISRVKKVNNFSDFILSKIPLNEITLIEVADCVNFFVIKGKTTSKTVLDLNQIKDEFIKTYKVEDEKKELFHTIDLIEYGVELNELESLSTTFFNTINPQYNICELSDESKINNDLIIKSSFPNGYSLKAGRDLYYYAKRISYNLQLYPFWNSIRIEINRTNNEENFKIFTDCSEEQDLKLKSAILDCFDFNYQKITKDFENSDWVNSSLEWSKDLDFIKEKNNDFILV